MKRIFYSIAIICAVGFSVKKIANEKATATVNQVQGVFLFVDCSPATQYDYLGSVEIKNSKYGDQYQPVRDALLKALKNKYTQADGAILHFVNGARDKADAIKFK